jgi:hypothetical protein
MGRNTQSEAAAMACLDAFMTAFNARDIKAFEQTFNFPSIRLASNTVHIDTRFTRYRKDGSVIGGFDSIYVVTCEEGHWGIKARSSFAP